jgi:hypothetical protein
MPFLILFIGILLVIVAIQGTQAQLVADLEQDLPGFFKWAVAIAAILGLGYIPGLQKPSRYLLALVVVVIFLKNYQQILSGLTSFATSSGATSTAQGVAAANPTAAYSEATAPAAATAAGETTTAVAAAQPTATVAQQTTTTTTTPTSATPTVTSLAGDINPTDYVTYYSPSVGFGGMAT